MPVEQRTSMGLGALGQGFGQVDASGHPDADFDRYRQII